MFTWFDYTTWRNLAALFLLEHHIISPSSMFCYGARVSGVLVSSFLIW